MNKQTGASETPIKDVLEDFALKNSWLVEDLGELRFDDTKITKADFLTLQQKSAFIARKGLDVWESLPLSREQMLEPSRMTEPEYRRLFARRKSELINSIGLAGVEEILKRKG